jgi:hypothetical protein
MNPVACKGGRPFAHPFENGVTFPVAHLSIVSSKQVYVSTIAAHE